MSFTITPDSPKALAAKTFGRELEKAAAARNVSWRELERQTGLGRSSLSNYRHGALLPKTEAAYALATVLGWPKLRDLIDAARQYRCQNPLCGRMYRNDTGAPNRYCSRTCRDAVASAKAAKSRANTAGNLERMGLPGRRTRSEADRDRRAAVRLTREEIRLYAACVEAFCRACEPEGMCRDAECDLRPVSPLPEALHPLGDVRSKAEIGNGSWSPERHAKHRDMMIERHRKEATG
ncbi:MAG: helix-turn-helix domain-containing protein [Limnohabitans sp.]